MELESSLRGLCEQPSGQAATDRMQLELGYGPLETKKQAPVGASGVVDAVAISNEATAQSEDPGRCNDPMIRQSPISRKLLYDHVT